MNKKFNKEQCSPDLRSLLRMGYLFSFFSHLIIHIEYKLNVNCLFANSCVLVIKLTTCLIGKIFLKK